VPMRMRKLNQDEAARTFPRRGQMDLSEYVDALAALQPGDAAAMDLGDLTTRAAKRRLGQAAYQRGYRLHWARGTDTLVVYFQVLANATPRTQRSGGSSGPGKPRRAVSRRATARVASQTPEPREPASAPDPASAQPRRGRQRNAVV